MGHQQMIFSVASTDERKPKQQDVINWAEAFRLKLIAKSELYEGLHPQPLLKLTAADISQLPFLFSKEDKEKHIEVHYDNHSESSSYAPLRMSQYLESEITLRFPFLRNQVVLSGSWDCQTVEEFLKKIENSSKEDIIDNWAKVCRQLSPRVDATLTLELYVEGLKYGTGALKERNKMYCPECHLQPFVYKIFQTGSKYIGSKLASPSISLEKERRINLKSLSRAKQFFCLICIRYDCVKHCDPSGAEENSYQYMHYINPMQGDRARLASSWALLGKHLSSNEDIKDSHGEHLSFDQEIKDSGSCGKQCYLRLDQKTVQKHSQSKAKVYSPIFLALVEMGIEIFHYCPCKIARLFGNNEEGVISCIQIYFYLLKEHRLLSKSQAKFKPNEIQELRSEKVYQIPMKIHRKKGRRSMEIHPQKYSGVCVHNYLYRPSFDLECLACACRGRGYCLPSCLCSPLCSIPLRGCCCQTGCLKGKCVCWRQGLSCSPDLCKGCFEEPCRAKCKNAQLVCKKRCLLRVGVSLKPNAGLGLFAGEDIEKGQMIASYSGEIVHDSTTQAIRDLLHPTLYSYVVTDNMSLDARYYGGKSRFVNHASISEANLECRQVSLNAEQVVAFFANRDILRDEQLLVDYDGAGTLSSFGGRYEFLKR